MHVRRVRRRTPACIHTPVPQETYRAVMSPYIFGIFISRSDLIPATTDVIR